MCVGEGLRILAERTSVNWLRAASRSTSAAVCFFSVSGDCFMLLMRAQLAFAVFTTLLGIIISGLFIA